MNAHPVTAHISDGVIYINGRRQRGTETQAMLTALWNSNLIPEYNALQNHIHSLDPSGEVAREIPENKRYVIHCAVSFGTTSIVRLRCISAFRSNIHDVSVEEGEITGWVLLPNVSNMISGNLIVREDSHLFGKGSRSYIEKSSILGSVVIGSTVIGSQLTGCIINDSEIIKSGMMYCDSFKSEVRDSQCFSSQISESSAVASELDKSNLFVTYASVSKIDFSSMRSCTFSKAIVSKSRLVGHISQVVGQGNPVSINDVTDDSTHKTMALMVEQADTISKRVSATNSLRKHLNIETPKWDVAKQEDGTILAKQEGSRTIIET